LLPPLPERAICLRPGAAPDIDLDQIKAVSDVVHISWLHHDFFTPRWRRVAARLLTLLFSTASANCQPAGPDKAPNSCTFSSPINTLVANLDYP
jgi:hypothetical protein